MEFTLIPQQKLFAQIDYYPDDYSVKTRVMHVNAELVSIRNASSGQRGLGSSRKRLRREPRRTPLLVSVSVKNIGEKAVIQCWLTASQEVDQVFKDYLKKLPRNTTAKLNLALVSLEQTNLGLIRFQDKIVNLAISENELRLTDTVDEFDFETWDDIDHPILATISMTLCMKEKSAELKGDKNHAIKMCKNILQNMEYADAKIEASNGVELPCHKVFLSAQSPFFQRMFASGMQESVSGSVAMLDVSEIAVRAMLSFIYCGNLEGTSINCQTALELLIAGAQYEITALEKATLNFLSIQSLEWFSTSVAVELWQFANKKTQNENNESYRFLEDKAVQVLKSKPANEIKECPAVFKMLENPQAGILEFCVYLLKNIRAASSQTTTSVSSNKQVGVERREGNCNAVAEPDSEDMSNSDSDDPNDIDLIQLLE